MLRTRWRRETQLEAAFLKGLHLRDRSVMLDYQVVESMQFGAEMQPGIQLVIEPTAHVPLDIVQARLNTA